MPLLDRHFALKCLSLLLRGAVRFCLRHGLRLQDLIESAKLSFISVASDELQENGERLNASRISAMTGVHRRDVSRLEQQGAPDSDARDIVTKVLGAWRSKDPLLTSSGEPRVLSCDGNNSEFAALVREISGDLNPATVLFELERVGAVSRSKHGAKLLATSYVPRGNPLSGFELVAKDADDLMRAGDENILLPQDLPQFHARTEFDNVRPEGIETLKRWFLREGHQFHARAREAISAYDQDINPDPTFKGRGIRVALGAFSYVASKPKK